MCKAIITSPVAKNGDWILITIEYTLKIISKGKKSMNIILFHLHIHSSQVNNYRFIIHFIKRMGRRTMISDTSYRMTQSFPFICFSTVLLWMNICSFSQLFYPSVHCFSPMSNDLVFMDTTRFLPELIVLEVYESEIFSRIFLYWKWEISQTLFGGRRCHMWHLLMQLVASGKKLASSGENNVIRKREQWQSNEESPPGIQALGSWWCCITNAFFLLHFVQLFL